MNLLFDAGAEKTFEARARGTADGSASRTQQSVAASAKVRFGSKVSATSSPDIVEQPERKAPIGS
jgi:hypothetical protein